MPKDLQVSYDVDQPSGSCAMCKTQTTTYVRNSGGRSVWRCTPCFQATVAASEKDKLDTNDKQGVEEDRDVAKLEGTSESFRQMRASYMQFLIKNAGDALTEAFHEGYQAGYVAGLKETHLGKGKGKDKEKVKGMGKGLQEGKISAKEMRSRSPAPKRPRTPQRRLARRSPRRSPRRSASSSPDA